MSLTQTSEQARRRDYHIPLGILLFTLALAAPFIGSRYVIHAIIIALVFMLPAHGLNLLVGYTGLLSLAQAAFFGIGAYAAGLLTITYGTPFYVNAVVAGLAAGAVALPLGVPALRLRSTSFVMCTLGFVIIGQAIAKNWISVTRGDMGLSGIPKPYFELGPLSFTVSGTTASTIWRSPSACWPRSRSSPSSARRPAATWWRSARTRRWPNPSACPPGITS